MCSSVCLCVQKPETVSLQGGTSLNFSILLGTSWPHHVLQKGKRMVVHSLRPCRHTLADGGKSGVHPGSHLCLSEDKTITVTPSKEEGSHAIASASLGGSEPPYHQPSDWERTGEQSY